MYLAAGLQSQHLTCQQLLTLLVLPAAGLWHWRPTAHARPHAALVRVVEQPGARWAPPQLPQCAWLALAAARGRALRHRLAGCPPPPPICSCGHRRWPGHPGAVHDGARPGPAPAGAPCVARRGGGRPAGAGRRDGGAFWAAAGGGSRKRRRGGGAGCGSGLAKPRGQQALVEQGSAADGAHSVQRPLWLQDRRSWGLRLHSEKSTGNGSKRGTAGKGGWKRGVGGAGIQ